MSTKACLFEDLGLEPSLLETLKSLGYEQATPIQNNSIPLLLENRDLLGIAQTGTGKTAAFALPVLSRLDIKQRKPQALVLTPTRELAIQVAEAFNSYAKNIKGFKVLAVYGGQDFRIQLKQLNQGVHVVVGTPGRIMDHLRREKLKLDELKTMVLDEADEMLRMGFIDDVEWILQHTPEKRQTALFSATMPKPIRTISQRYMHDPVEITVKQQQNTADTIDQFYWQLNNHEKPEVLVRLLETETIDGVIVFVRTKNATIDVASKLQAQGFAAEALNGDIAQNHREKIVKQLKQGNIDILVATDVAARGLDVDRISHVVNYDVPFDTESYVHRIGRTGRAGRNGKAILFITNREKRLLSAIEKSGNKRMNKFRFPDAKTLNERKKTAFFNQLDEQLKQLPQDYKYLVNEYLATSHHSAEDVAAALAAICHSGKPFFLENAPVAKKQENRKKEKDSYKTRQKDKPEKLSARENHKSKDTRKHSHSKDKDIPMQVYRLAVGSEHGVEKSDIVGAIANEADIDSKYMGKILMDKESSTIELPEGMPKELYKHLKKVWVKGHQLKIELAEPKAPKPAKQPKKRPAKYKSSA